CHAVSMALIGREWRPPFSVFRGHGSPAPREASPAPQPPLVLAPTPNRTGSTAIVPRPLAWPPEAAITPFALEPSPVASRVRKSVRSAPVNRRHEPLFPLVVPRLLECLTNTSCVRYLHLSRLCDNEFAGGVDHHRNLRFALRGIQ